MKFEYHHIGIPTKEKREGEEYIAKFKMYVSGYDTNEFKIQWMRFEEDSPFHPLIQTLPHVAFKVDDLEKAIQGKKVLLEPYFPLEGFKVAFIEEEGAPVELIETNLTEEELIERASRHRS